MPDTSIPPPIFVLGALRSGTTVFRLMLDHHEGINCPDEADFIFDYLTSGPTSKDWVCDLDGLRLDRTFRKQKLSIANSKDGTEVARYFIEQMRGRAPGIPCLVVHRHAGKIASIFPDSKIIHLVRDPRDVASSSIGMGWAGNTYYGVDQWIKTESEWSATALKFDQQAVLQIKFKDLISDPRAQLEIVCEFIGVPFSPAMLTYNNDSTYDPPDPSMIQQWRRKLRPREIALVEIKAKSLLLERRFELSGHSLEPPDLRERLSLFWGNKLYKWRFGIRRYGVVNFLMEKVTRRAIKSFHPMFRQRLDEIDEQHLK